MRRWGNYLRWEVGEDGWRRRDGAGRIGAWQLDLLAGLRSKIPMPIGASSSRTWSSSWPRPSRLAISGAACSLFRRQGQRLLQPAQGREELDIVRDDIVFLGDTTRAVAEEILRVELVGRVRSQLCRGGRPQRFDRAGDAGLRHLLVEARGDGVRPLPSPSLSGLLLDPPLSPPGEQHDLRIPAPPLFQEVEGLPPQFVADDRRGCVSFRLAPLSLDDAAIPVHLVLSEVVNILGQHP